MSKIEQMDTRKFLRLLEDIKDSDERKLYDLEMQSISNISETLDSEGGKTPGIVSHKVGIVVEHLKEKFREKWELAARIVKIERSMTNLNEFKNKLKRANEIGRIFANKRDEESIQLMKDAKEQLKTLTTEYDEILRDLQKLKKEFTDMESLYNSLVNTQKEEENMIVEARKEVREAMAAVRKRKKGTNSDEFKSLDSAIFPHVNVLFKTYKEITKHFEKLKKKILNLEKYERKLEKTTIEAKHQVYKMEAA